MLTACLMSGLYLIEKLAQVLQKPNPYPPTPAFDPRHHDEQHKDAREDCPNSLSPATVSVTPVRHGAGEASRSI